MQKSLVLKVSIVIVVQLVIWFFKIAPNECIYAILRIYRLCAYLHFLYSASRNSLLIYNFIKYSTHQSDFLI
jgi:hypothetical protein